MCGALVATEARAADIQIGTYQLHNHPDGNRNPPPYGFRLDELFNFTSGHDVITFDFDAPGADMRMDYDGTSLHIYGTAFGGLQAGSVYSANPSHTSFVTIDMTYSIANLLPGDDDLIVTTPNYTNMGTITWQDTGEVVNFWDYSGNHGYTFQLGDEADDSGHRDFNGISGWGWVNHGVMTTHIGASDFLFTAELIPLPPAAIMGFVGLIGVVAVRRRLA